jgi:hypothetical protein
MLAKCANPACSRTFRYLREGKLFRIETEMEASPANGNVSGRAGEWYWLCDECAKKFTVEKQRGTAAVAVPRRPQVALAAL